MPIIDPIYNHLEKYIIIDPVTNCWIWQKGKDSGGYGNVWNPNCKRVVRTHVVFYERKYGKVPFGLVLDHVICSNPPCCNPDHVSPKKRGINASRPHREKTHCTHGHEYTTENTYFTKEGHRRCRKCNRTGPVAKYKRIMSRRITADPDNIREA